MGDLYVKIALYAPTNIMIIITSPRRVKENMQILADFHIENPPVLVEWKYGKLYVKQNVLRNYHCSVFYFK